MLTVRAFALLCAWAIALPLYAEDPPYPNAASATPEIASLMKTANDAYMQCTAPEKIRVKVGPSAPYPKFIKVDPIAWPQLQESATTRQGRIVLELVVSRAGIITCSRILSCTVPDLAVAKASLSVNGAFHFAPAVNERGEPISSFALISIVFLSDGKVEIK